MGLETVRLTIRKHSNALFGMEVERDYSNNLAKAADCLERNDASFLERGIRKASRSRMTAFGGKADIGLAGAE